MVWFSYHGGHSGEFCGHAKGKLRDVVERAVALGFTTYGLSEHCPRVRRQDLYDEEAAAALTPSDLEHAFALYVTEAAALKEAFRDRLELLVGFESEALPEDSWRDLMRSVRRQHPFDFVVGSVHSVHGVFIDYRPELNERLSEELGGWSALCRAYFDQVAELVAELRPSIAGHLDLVRRFRGPDVTFDASVWPHIERALEAVLATGALLEVNATPVRKGFGPVYPTPAILRRAHEMGVPVTLSDDSHAPELVGGALDACLRAIHEAGYTRVHYLSRNGDLDGPVQVLSADLADVKPVMRGSR
jgi:histidinol-phosphatase (PHP family)